MIILDVVMMDKRDIIMSMKNTSIKNMLINTENIHMGMNTIMHLKSISMTTITPLMLMLQRKSTNMFIKRNTLTSMKTTLPMLTRTMNIHMRTVRNAMAITTMVRNTTTPNTLTNTKTTQKLKQNLTLVALTAMEKTITTTTTTITMRTSMACSSTSWLMLWEVLESSFPLFSSGTSTGLSQTLSAQS